MTQNEDNLVRSFGYKPQLERSIGWFASFAASFSGVSISTAVFVLPYVWTQAGSAGIWTWLISTAGAFMVALIFADLVGRIPLAGYAYQWSSRLTDLRIGWFVAAAGLIGFVVGTAGTTYGAVPYFLEDLGIHITTATKIEGAIVFIAVLMFINIQGVRLASRINSAAVVTEIVGGVLVTIGILVYAIIHHPHPVSFLFQQQPGAHGSYFGPFTLAFLLGAFIYAGWELPADLAEETKDASNVAAKSMLVSLGAVAVCGMILLVSFTYASPNIATSLSSDVPVYQVIDYQWGETAREIVSIVFLVSFVAVNLLLMMAASRLLFSLARDRVLPFSSALTKVSKRHKSPYAAVLAVGTLAIIIFTVPALISTDALNYVVGTASVGYNLTYAMMAGIFLYKVRSGSLPESHGRFSLGRWAQPVALIALVWQVFLVGTLTVPNVNRSVGYMTLGMLGLAFVWYLVKVRPGWRDGTIGPGRVVETVPGEGGGTIPPADGPGPGAAAS